MRIIAAAAHDEVRLGSFMGARVGTPSSITNVFAGLDDIFAELAIMYPSTVPPAVTAPRSPRRHGPPVPAGPS